jgi:hypothetical protein
MKLIHPVFHRSYRESGVARERDGARGFLARGRRRHGPSHGCNAGAQLLLILMVTRPLLSSYTAISAQSSTEQSSPSSLGSLWEALRHRSRAVRPENGRCWSEALVAAGASTFRRRARPCLRSTWQRPPGQNSRSRQAAPYQQTPSPFGYPGKYYQFGIPRTEILPSLHLECPL